MATDQPGPGPEVLPLAKKANFLNFPYNVREKVYIEVLSSAPLELVLHARPKEVSGTGWVTSICFARRSPLKKQQGLDYTKEDDARQMYQAGKAWDTLKDMPQGKTLAETLGHLTLYNVLATCKQVRKEVTEIFWIRTDFNCVLNIMPPSWSKCLNILCHEPIWHPRSTEVGIQHGLPQLEASFGSAKIGESIQKLNLQFDENQVRKVFPTPEQLANMPPGDVRSRDQLIGVMTTLLARLPKLKHINFIFVGKDPMRIEHTPCIDEFFTAIRPIKTLQSVRFQDVKPDEGWKSQVNPDVKLSFEQGSVSSIPVCISSFHPDSKRGWQFFFGGLVQNDSDLPDYSKPLNSEELNQLEVATWFEALGIPELARFHFFVRELLSYFSESHTNRSSGLVSEPLASMETYTRCTACAGITISYPRQGQRSLDAMTTNLLELLSSGLELFCLVSYMELL